MAVYFLKSWVYSGARASWVYSGAAEHPEYTVVHWRRFSHRLPPKSPFLKTFFKIDPGVYKIDPGVPFIFKFLFLSFIGHWLGFQNLDLVVFWGTKGLSKESVLYSFQKNTG